MSCTSCVDAFSFAINFEMSLSAQRATDMDRDVPGRRPMPEPVAQLHGIRRPGTRPGPPSGMDSVVRRQRQLNLAGYSPCNDDVPT